MDVRDLFARLCARDGENVLTEDRKRILPEGSEETYYGEIRNRLRSIYYDFIVVKNVKTTRDAAALTRMLVRFALIHRVRHDVYLCNMAVTSVRGERNNEKKKKRVTRAR